MNTPLEKKRVESIQENNATNETKLLMKPKIEVKETNKVKKKIFFKNEIIFI